MKPECREGSLAHVRNAFRVTVHAPYQEAAPLFGRNGERVWAGSLWDPQFFYPQPGQDVTSIDEFNTKVDVMYTRTALDAEANEHVREPGASGRQPFVI